MLKILPVGAPERPLTTRILVRLVLAVGFAVTEQLLVDALAVAAGQLALRADRLVRLQDRQNLAWL